MKVIKHVISAHEDHVEDYVEAIYSAIAPIITMYKGNVEIVMKPYTEGDPHEVVMVATTYEAYQAIKGYDGCIPGVEVNGKVYMPGDDAKPVVEASKISVTTYNEIASSSCNTVDEVISAYPEVMTP